MPCVWESHRRVIVGRMVIVSFALLTPVLGGCAVSPASSATHQAGLFSTAPSGTPCPPSGCVVASGVSGVQVFVEPDAGAGPIVNAIRSAHTSISVEVYLLTDSRVIHALEDAENRGVQVQVLLEPQPYGEGAIPARQTIDTLTAAGIQAKTSDPAYHYTHAKAMVIDSAVAYILSCNLTRSGLGGTSTTANRDYGVIDANAPDVREVAAIFDADWNRTQPTLSDPNLVISPVNARSRLTALIASAHNSLTIEDEEMYDTQSESVLSAAAKRGVRVELVLPAPQAGGSSNAADVQRLLAGGVQVRYLAVPYVHAKLIVADGTEAFVGSENFSSTSLDQNREIGVLIADRSALAELTGAFTRDWASAAAA